MLPWRVTLMKLNAYLNFGGNCRQAFEYYEQHLGAKIVMSMTFNQSPDQSNVPPGAGDQILYANLSIADTQIMGSDTPNYEPIRSSYLTLSVPEADVFDKSWKALADGGEILMPRNETFFAYEFGILRDKFNVLWMLIREKPMQ
jgi:PhnB protein